MTVEQVKGSDRQVGNVQWTLENGVVTPKARPQAEPLSWFKSLVLRRRANAMLRRMFRRPRQTKLHELSPYLLRDIGLPPDSRS